MTLYPAFGRRRPLKELLNNISPVKRKVFISYHHANDQLWYDTISHYFSSLLDLFYDNSLERKEDSKSSIYLNRKIREEYIWGTSVTMVLCGSETWKRRWVDWEIYATLHYQHGLLGIALPTCVRSYDSKFIVPPRLHENVASGYAVMMAWTTDADFLGSQISEAARRSSQKSLMRNSTFKMKRSIS